MTKQLQETETKIREDIKFVEEQMALARTLPDGLRENTLKRHRGDRRDLRRSLRAIRIAIEDETA